MEKFNASGGKLVQYQEMQRRSILFIIFLFVSFAIQAFTATGGGPVELDEYNFDKIINKFEASLIKFDILYPFGDKHEAFMTFAKDSINEKNLLIAQVLVKSYADKTNVALARKYGATEDNLPVVMLFVRGKEPLLFGEDAEGFTSDKLRRFVSENSGLYLSLPGCVKEFDMLAIQFMKSKKVERKNVLKETEELLKSMKDTSCKIYKTIMEKVLEEGENSIQSEVDRLNKLMSGKVSDGKKKQLGTRINILQTFQSVNEKADVKHDL